MKSVKMKRVTPGIVYEQIAPSIGARERQTKETQKDTAAGLYAKMHPKEYKIAKTIYDGRFGGKNVIKAIEAVPSRNIKQYSLVTKILQIYTEGKGIAAWLKTFVRLAIPEHAIALTRLMRDMQYAPSFQNNHSWTLDEFKKRFGDYTQDVFDPNKPFGKSILMGYMMPAAGRFIKDHRHEILLTASIATSFIPVFGLFISGGIGLLDAGLYYKEGNRLEAGTMAIFSLLPGIGPILKRIPGIKFLVDKMGKKLAMEFMANMGKKLATSNYTTLNKLEMEIIRDLAKYKGAVDQDLNVWFKARAKNELVRALPAARPTLSKIADGSIIAGKYVANTIKGISRIAKPFVQFEIANDAWMKLYKKYNLELYDYMDQSESDAKELLDSLKYKINRDKKENELTNPEHLVLMKFIKHVENNTKPQVLVRPESKNMKTNNNSLMLESIIKRSLFEQGSLVFDKDKGKRDNKKQTNDPGLKQDSGALMKVTGAFIILSAIGTIAGSVAMKMGLIKAIPSLHKFLLKYFGGKISNFGNWIASPAGRRQIIKRTEYLYGKGKIDKATRDKIINAMDDPKTISILRNEIMQIAKKEFLKGDISAAEYLSTLEKSVAEKYRAEFEALEQQGLAGKRTAPKTTTPKKPKPKTYAQMQVFKPIKPVTEKQFANVIKRNQRTIQNIYDSPDELKLALKALKSELMNTSKPVFRFKQDIKNFGDYLQACFNNKVELPAGYDDRFHKWQYYQLKQLFK